MLAAGLLVALGTLVVQGEIRFGGIALTLVGGATWACARLAMPGIAARTMVWSMLLGGGLTALSKGGLTNPAVVIGLPLAVGIAGLMLDRRESSLLIGASIAIVMGLLGLEVSGNAPAGGIPAGVSAIAVVTAVLLSTLFSTEAARAIRRQFEELEAGKIRLAHINENLSAREMRWTLAAQAARLAAFEWDFARGRALWSEGAEQVVGCAKGALPDHRGALFAWVHEDDRRALLRAIVEGMGPHGSGRIESLFRVRRPDGELRWMQLKGRADAEPGATNSIGKIDRSSLYCVIADETEMRLAQRQVEFLAYHDPLTRLPNRRGGLERLHQVLERARHDGAEVAILCVNLEEFQRINASFGETVGDRVLQGMAERLTDAQTGTRLVFHLGGDHFALALEGLRSGIELQQACERLQDRLVEPFTIEGQRIVVFTGIGVAQYPRDGESPDELLDKSIAAMRQASQAGHRMLRFFDEQTGNSQRKYVETRDALRAGIDRGEFELHYQPQIDLRTGAAVGAEALLRWRRPGHGLLAPREFIEAAERSGLIIPLGRWVLSEAFRQATSWPAVSGRLPHVSVNVSAAQFGRVELGGEVMSALQASGLSAERVELELTESLLLVDEDQTLETLENWKSHGISLALDDFGTGYASISYLDRLEIDVMKIDQTFVRAIEPGNRQSVLCEAMVRMAHKLGLRVVAEGIETPQQLAFLTGIGCDLGQGYLLAKPLEAAELQAFFARSEHSGRPAAGLGNP